MGLAFSGKLRREGDVSDSANVCGAGPLGDRSLPRKLFGEGTRILLQAGQGLASSGGRAMSPKAPCVRCRTARRSVPTGGGFGKERGSCHRLAEARGAPGVGRCLRQRHVCGAGPLGDRSLPRRLFESGTRVLVLAYQGPASSGGRAISPTAPCVRCRTARRSVPTGEAVWVWDALGDRSLPGGFG